MGPGPIYLWAFAILLALNFGTIMCLREIMVQHNNIWQIMIPFGKWRGMSLGDVQSRFPQDLVDLSERKLFVQRTESCGVGTSGRRILLQPRDNVWDAVHEVISKQEYFQEVSINLSMHERTQPSAWGSKFSRMKT
jgi:hypothetical protein